MSVVWRDMGWKHALESANAFGRLVIKAGVVGPAADETHGDSKLTNAEVAAINEFGSDDGHVPRRSFIKSTFEWNNERVANKLAQAVHDAVFKKRDAHKALSKAGEWARDQIRKTLKTAKFLPNAPATIAKKGSDKPLFDSEQMFEAISYTIESGLAHIFGDYEEVQVSGLESGE